MPLRDRQKRPNWGYFDICGKILGINFLHSWKNVAAFFGIHISSLYPWGKCCFQIKEADLRQILGIRLYGCSKNIALSSLFSGVYQAIVSALKIRTPTDSPSFQEFSHLERNSLRSQFIRQTNRANATSQNTASTLRKLCSKNNLAACYTNRQGR